MEVGVRVEAEQPRDRRPRATPTPPTSRWSPSTTTAAPTAVPPLEAESDDEQRREREAQTRRRNRLAERDQIVSASRGETPSRHVARYGTGPLAVASGSYAAALEAERVARAEPRVARSVERQRGPLPRRRRSPAVLVSRRSPAITT